MTSSGGRTRVVARRPVVQAIIMELSPLLVASLGPQTKLVAELGYDSLGLLELIAVLEDTLEISIDDEDLGGIEVVADLERIVIAAEATTTSPEKKS